MRKHKADDILPEYDFSKGVRGKYAKQFQLGSAYVLLQPDVAKVFRDAKMVNEALRMLAKIAVRKAVVT